MKPENKYMHDILSDLNNPENIVYKDALHMLTLQPYLNIVYGAGGTFKFELSKLGEDALAKLNE